MDSCLPFLSSHRELQDFDNVLYSRVKKNIRITFKNTNFYGIWNSHPFLPWIFKSRNLCKIFLKLSISLMKQNCALLDTVLRKKKRKKGKPSKERKKKAFFFLLFCSFAATLIYSFQGRQKHKLSSQQKTAKIFRGVHLICRRPKDNIFIVFGGWGCSIFATASVKKRGGQNNYLL